MVVEEDNMDCLKVYVGTTTMTMNDRFTLLATTPPFQGAAPRRVRRSSTNDGPLLNPYTVRKNQDLVDKVVQQLGLDWRVQELQQQPARVSRAGSLSRSRASSMSRYGGEEVPGLVRTNSWGNLSRANSVKNLNQWSGQSHHFAGGFRDNFRAVSFANSPALDLNRRLQMRDAWMRGRRARGRGRGRARGGHDQRGRIVRRNWYQQTTQQGRGRWRARNSGFQRGRGGNRYWGRGQRWRSSFTPRGRAGQIENGSEGNGTAGRGQGSGRGRGGMQRGGISQNRMPALKTLEQLDKELEEYMASTPATLNKQLEEYMAQSEIIMDIE